MQDVLAVAVEPVILIVLARRVVRRGDGGAAIRETRDIAVGVRAVEKTNVLLRSLVVVVASLRIDGRIFEESSGRLARQRRVTIDGGVRRAGSRDSVMLVLVVLRQLVLLLVLVLSLLRLQQLLSLLRLALQLL